MSDKPPAGHFRILYFASAKSYTQKAFDDFPAPMPIHDLFGVLEKSYEGIHERVLSSSAVTVNLEYVDLDPEENTADTAQASSQAVIKEGDEVAIIPPVSAG